MELNITVLCSIVTNIVASYFEWITNYNQHEMTVELFLSSSSISLSHWFGRGGSANNSQNPGIARKRGWGLSLTPAKMTDNRSRQCQDFEIYLCGHPSLIYCYWHCQLKVLQ